MCDCRKVLQLPVRVQPQTELCPCTHPSDWPKRRHVQSSGPPVGPRADLSASGLRPERRHDSLPPLSLREACTQCRDSQPIVIPSAQLAPCLAHPHQRRSFTSAPQELTPELAARFVALGSPLFLRRAAKFLGTVRYRPGPGWLAIRGVCQHSSVIGCGAQPMAAVGPGCGRQSRLHRHPSPADIPGRPGPPEKCRRDPLVALCGYDRPSATGLSINLRSRPAALCRQVESRAPFVRQP